MDNNNTPTRQKLFHLISTPANPVNEVQINANASVQDHLEEIEVALNEAPNVLGIQRKVEFFFRVVGGQEGQLCFLSDPPIDRKEVMNIASAIARIDCESYT